jgi:hypothetical protein
VWEVLQLIDGFEIRCKVMRMCVWWWSWAFILLIQGFRLSFFSGGILQIKQPVIRLRC